MSENLRLKTFLWVTLLFSSIAGAAFARAVAAESTVTDTSELSLTRRKQLAAISFYCPVGRSPMQNSSDGWQIRPIPGCSFNGPLDTKINRLKLEPPLLNPVLGIPGLKAAVGQLGLQITSESGGALSFRLPGGQTLSASILSAKSLQDPLFHFGAIPLAWGTSFVSIAASSTNDIPAFIALAKTLPGNPVFWANPQYDDEPGAISHLQRANTYNPVNLVSKCGDGQAWRAFGANRRSLLITGDLHDPPQTEFFTNVVLTQPFAWVGLEMPNDMTPTLNAFLSAADSVSEEAPLTSLTFQYPKNLVEPTKALLRKLKALKATVVLFDTATAYFNFPFTDVSFHGMVMSTRNSVWARNLPADWTGPAVILGGLDHFIATPSSDFQDYARERFPGLELALISPYEVCP